jgi:hypothetical protein
MIRKLMAMTTGLACGLACGLAAPAFADEVWVTRAGNQIVYDRDAGSTAIWTYVPEQGLAKGQIFLSGFAGAESRAGGFEGIWVEEDDAGPACAFSIVDAEGRAWKRWGIVRVKFAKPTFPSAITLTRGACLSDPKTKVQAKPVIGAGLN